MKAGWLIFVLLMPVTAALGAELPASDQNLRIIQMEGHGEARANPDQAFISFAIETKGSTAREAATQNAQIATKVIAALKSKVAPGGKVETGGYALSPLYAGTPRPTVTRIGNWTAMNNVTVECDLSLSGGVLDAAQTAGVQGSSNTGPESGRATTELSVTASALSANEASRLSAEKARKLVDTIKAKLGGKGTVRIGSGWVQPESEPVGNQPPEMIGYQASNSISVETAGIDRVGSLIDTAIGAGANRAGFVTFNLRDDSKARSEAIAEACKDAQLKANAAAQALGLKVKRVIKIISVGDFRPQQAYRESPSFSVQGVATPIKQGELTVPAAVTVTYEIE